MWLPPARTQEATRTFRPGRFLFARSCSYDRATAVRPTTRPVTLNVRRNFRSLLSEAGFENPKEWTPRELRTSFVSVLSDHGIPIEVISRLVGHNGSGTTERVYRKQLRPVISEGAEAMDDIFGDDDDPVEDDPPDGP
ncbi:tyrosine-type recombinase/integrase [Streptomyces sp. NPDC002520]